MKNPQHIMKAISLLQSKKVKDPLPWWFVTIDYVLATCLFVGFWGGVVFLISKLISWL